ncbi:MAG: hypothetical protein NLN64_06375 [Candidatus Thalassarchaeaceae archaeon]|nr:hypothetical protein [Candidatus Thalassarchaeaceae archaeon]
MDKFFDKLFDTFMGSESNEFVRKIAISSAVLGFLAHLLIWILYVTDMIQIKGDSVELVSSPLSSLYTPFSILLAYEIYELIRTIPNSFSSAVGKQYEIATLLVVRDILKRLSAINLSDDWKIDDDLGLLLVECCAFLALFYTSLTYYNISSNIDANVTVSDHVSSFVSTKKAIANVMLLFFIIIAIMSLTGWISSAMQGGGSVNREIFFLDFFTFLILADILILLMSYWFYSDFGNLARNTGFVLSTVIIRVAISTTGVSSMILFALSGFLGIMILKISDNISLKYASNSKLSK